MQTRKKKGISVKCRNSGCGAEWKYRGEKTINENVHCPKCNYRYKLKSLKSEFRDMAKKIKNKARDKNG